LETIHFLSVLINAYYRWHLLRTRTVELPSSPEQNKVIIRHNKCTSAGVWDYLNIVVY